MNDRSVGYDENENSGGSGSLYRGPVSSLCRAWCGMKEILGFAVLTGPLWLILILLVASFWIARKISKRFKRRSTQIVSGIGVFLLIFLVPFGDEIAGRIYLNHLCATEAGVKVYQTVELPADYWGARGNPKFYFNSDKFGKTRYIFPDKTIEEPRLLQRESDSRYSRFLYVHKRVSYLTESDSGKTVGEIIRFRFWGGLDQEKLKSA